MTKLTEYTGSSRQNNEKNNKCLEKFGEDKLVKKTLDEMSCQFPGTPRSTYLMVFSPDGKKVASTHGDHNIHVVNLETGICICSLQGHPRTPWCLTFHPSSNNILASGCLGGEVRVWDLHGGSETWITEKQDVITSLAFHPLDHVLVIATGYEIFFWDWSKPKPFASCSTKNRFEKIRYVNFDPLGQNLVTGIENIQSLLQSSSERARNRGRISRIIDLPNFQIQEYTDNFLFEHQLELARNEESANEIRAASPLQLENFYAAINYAQFETLRYRSNIRTNDIYDQREEQIQHMLNESVYESDSQVPFQVTPPPSQLSNSFNYWNSRRRNRFTVNRQRERRDNFEDNVSIDEQLQNMHHRLDYLYEQLQHLRNILQHMISVVENRQNQQRSNSDSDSYLFSIFGNYNVLWNLLETMEDTISLACGEINHRTNRQRLLTSSSLPPNRLLRSTRLFNGHLRREANSRSTILTSAQNVFLHHYFGSNSVNNMPSPFQLNAQSIINANINRFASYLNPSIHIASLREGSVQENLHDPYSNFSMNLRRNIMHEHSQPNNSYFNRILARDNNINEQTENESFERQSVTESYRRRILSILESTQDLRRERFFHLLNLMTEHLGVLTNQERPNQEFQENRTELDEQLINLQFLLRLAPYVFQNLNSYNNEVEERPISRLPNPFTESAAEPVILRPLLQEHENPNQNSYPISVMQMAHDTETLTSDSEIIRSNFPLLNNTSRTFGRLLESSTREFINPSYFDAGNMNVENSSNIQSFSYLPTTFDYGCLFRDYQSYLTHRIQIWDFSSYSIPDISDECKIHNEASVEISSDGKLLATFIPYRIPFTTLAVYSMERHNFGQCLHQWNFGRSAVSVSLSISRKYLVVGLASRRILFTPVEKQIVGQIFELLTTDQTGHWNLKHIRDLEYCEDESLHVSVNCIKWLPNAGQGFIFGTNTGQLKLLI